MANTCKIVNGWSECGLPCKGGAVHMGCTAKVPKLTTVEFIGKTPPENSFYDVSEPLPREMCLMHLAPFEAIDATRLLPIGPITRSYYRLHRDADGHPFYQWQKDVTS
jgi:hypothetical protein